MPQPGHLPRSAPLSTFERALAIRDAGSFVDDVPGPAVLVRLDERGGADEAVPWAFPSTERLQAAIEAAAGDDDAEDDVIFIDPSFTADSDEATATGPSQPPLPLPPARERAAVTVVPPGGGRIGRDDASAIRIVERSVSRRHAAVTIDDDVWSIVDLDSDNGTGVNGMVLVPGIPHPLKSGDVVHLGDVSFIFLDVAAFASHLPALAGR
jgi:hypothetical protein